MRHLLNLRKRHIARLVQLFMIEAGLAKRIAARGHKQDYRPKPLFALGRAHKLNKLDGFVRHSLLTNIFRVSLASLPKPRAVATGNATTIRKGAIEGRSLPLAVL